MDNKKADKSQGYRRLNFGLGLFLAYYSHLCHCPMVRGISNFLEELSNLSHSTVLLYFFVLFTQESFAISPRYSLEIRT